MQSRYPNSGSLTNKVHKFGRGSEGNRDGYVQAKLTRSTIFWVLVVWGEALPDGHIWATLTVHKFWGHGGLEGNLDGHVQDKLKKSKTIWVVVVFWVGVVISMMFSPHPGLQQHQSKLLIKMCQTDLDLKMRKY